MYTLSGTRRQLVDQCVLTIVEVDLCLYVSFEDILVYGRTCNGPSFIDYNAVFQSVQKTAFAMSFWWSKCFIHLDA